MKIKHSFIYTAILFGTLTSCVSIVATSNTTRDAAATPSYRTVNDVALNGKVYSAVWQQNSGEFRALCYQAYNIAKIRVNEATAKKNAKPLAIITDIDETFLDNSPYAVTQAKKGNEFDQKSWNEWTSKGNAIAYPGSLDFFNHAAKKGITIFYITNRNVQDKPGTMKNLKNLGFPFADDNHVMVMNTTSDKEERRQAILKDYDVVMYLGDNLTDFSQLFYKKPQAERNAKVDELEKEFGAKFIVLPNSGYGDWEGALPGFNNKLSPKEKDEVFLKNLKGY